MLKIVTNDSRFDSILDISNFEISSKTLTNIFNATTTAISPAPEPNLRLLVSVAMTPSPPIMLAKRVSVCPRSSICNPSRLFNTPTMIFNEPLSAISAKEPLESCGTNLPRIPAVVASPASITPMIPRFFQILLSSSCSIDFSVFAKIATEAAQPSIDVAPKAFFVPPSLLISAEIPTNAADKAPSTPTDVHKLS